MFFLAFCEVNYLLHLSSRQNLFFSGHPRKENVERIFPVQVERSNEGFEIKCSFLIEPFFKTLFLATCLRFSFFPSILISSIGRFFRIWCEKIINVFFFFSRILSQTFDLILLKGLFIENYNWSRKVKA